MSILIASPSAGSAFAGVTTDNITVFGDGLNVPLSAQFTQTGKYIISGGISWSGTGYVYDVSALQYFFDGYYTANPTQVTMAAADPTDNRFDAVVVDVAGTITVITGTASANPALPTIPDDKLVVGYVLVEAGTISPSILQDNIYIDNTEWATSTYTTGIGSTGTIDFNSTDTPKEGSKCIDFVTNQRLGAKFTRATAIDVQQFAFVQVWYRNNGTALATNKTPTIRFDNSAGNPVGNTVSLINHGISRTVVGTWQLAVIPVSAFGSVTLVKGLRAIMTGGTLASQASFSLDFMLLSGGILPQGALGPIYLSQSNTLYSTGAANGATSNSDSIFFGQNSGFQAINASSVIALGKSSGYQSSSVDGAVFIGEEAGYQAVDSINSVFIGKQAGYGATNTVPSIAIGNASTPLSYNNSILLGFQVVASANNQMTIGSVPIPINEVIINGTGGIQVPVGTTAERIATQGMIRYNTTTSKFEGYDGSTWSNLN